MSIAINPSQTDPREKRESEETENVSSETLAEDSTEDEDEDELNEQVDEEMAEEDE